MPTGTMSGNAVKNTSLTEQEWQNVWEDNIDKDGKLKASNAKVKNKASGDKRRNKGKHDVISKRVNGGERGVTVQHVAMDTGSTETDADRVNQYKYVKEQMIKQGNKAIN
eukprot:15026948-Ditylum_brightwellii.AAC.1